MTVYDMLTPEQREFATSQKMAMRKEHGGPRFGVGESAFRMTRAFHHAMGIPSPAVPFVPTVTERERRLRLILEEFLELVEAMGFQLTVDSSDPEHEWNGDVGERLIVEYIGGSHYDVVETADALGDLNVVVNGTSAEFGIPQEAVDYEIYCSNMTKLGPDGKPIINGVTEGYREGEDGYKPDAPVGKILKPAGFVPANIPAVLALYSN